MVGWPAPQDHSGTEPSGTLCSRAPISEPNVAVPVTPFSHSMGRGKKKCRVNGFDFKQM